MNQLAAFRNSASQMRSREGSGLDGDFAGFNGETGKWRAGKNKTDIAGRRLVAAVYHLITGWQKFFMPVTVSLMAGTSRQFAVSYPTATKLIGRREIKTPGRCAGTSRCLIKKRASNSFSRRALVAARMRWRRCKTLSSIVTRPAILPTTIGRSLS
jgi:hypothetical protein